MRGRPALVSPGLLTRRSGITTSEESAEWVAPSDLRRMNSRAGATRLLDEPTPAPHRASRSSLCTRRVVNYSSAVETEPMTASLNESESISGFEKWSSRANRGSEGLNGTRRRRLSVRVPDASAGEDLARAICGS